MFFNLTELSNEPIHQQIARQVRSRVFSGALPEGEPLPLPRSLARQQRVSKLSIERAYRQLIAEGLLAEGQGGRYEVSALPAGQRQEWARQRLFETLREQELSVRELELARDIQCRLLPPTYIDGSRYRITCRNDPAGFVTGDFYDVIRHDDGRIALVVADVAGKGLGASLIMASVKAILPFLTAGRAAAEALCELNGRLRRELRRREFVAMACAVYEPASGRFELANAGMPDPYLLRSGEPVDVVEVMGDRLPLGLRSEVRYESVEHRLEPGDRLLWVSDGLPECPTETGEPLGYRRFAELLTSLPIQDKKADLVEEVFARVRRASGQEIPTDDWTALLLERRV